MKAKTQQAAKLRREIELGQIVVKAGLENIEPELLESELLKIAAKLSKKSKA